MVKDQRNERENMTHTIEFDEVKACGSAGGEKRNSYVQLALVGKADTVESIRLLVAAAPELLEACKRALELCQSLPYDNSLRSSQQVGSKTSDMLQDVINKAEGK